MSLETAATAASTTEGSCNPARDRPTKRLVRSAVPRVLSPDRTSLWKGGVLGVQGLGDQYTHEGGVRQDTTHDELVQGRRLVPSAIGGSHRANPPQAG